MSTQVRNHLIRALLGLLAVLFFTLDSIGLFQLPVITRLDHLFYDFKVAQTPRNDHDESVVILDVDEKSLGNPNLGRWPWSRDKLAIIVEKLFDDYGIAVLGFDIVWAEPDESSGEKLLARLSAGPLKNNKEFLSTYKQIRPQLMFDELFASSIENYPIVLGYYFNFDTPSTKKGLLPDPVLESMDMAGTEVLAQHAKGYNANLPLIQEATIFSGHFNPTLDIDGVIRRIPLLVGYENKFYESLSLAVFRLYKSMLIAGTPQGSFPERILGVDVFPKSKQHAPHTPLESILIGDSAINVDVTGNMLVPYKGPRGSFKYFSIADLIDDKLDKDALRGKIVLIGTTAPGLSDFRSTPAGPFFPGVEVHANAISGMLSSDKLIKAFPPYLHTAGIIILSGVGISLALIVPLLSPLNALGITILALCGALGMNFYAWNIGLSMPVTGLLLTIFSVFVLNMLYGYFIESKTRRDFTALFGQYVPPKLVAIMAKDPTRYSMEGEKKELTILFTDVVGFTGISEKLSPHDLSRFINRYLTEMSDIISQNEGTIDKYIGDAIMAFWGAPIGNADHAAAAVRAAIEIQNRVNLLNQDFRSKGWPDLRLGIGVASGNVIVGDMGSSHRRAYTVIGDTVNLAARLEGATRHYGISTLIAETTVLACKSENFRLVDLVQVKGKENPIQIYEPLELIKSSDISNELKLWSLLLDAYRSGNWEACATYLAESMEKFPESNIFVKMEERIARARETDPSSWAGVTRLEAK